MARNNIIKNFQWLYHISRCSGLGSYHIPSKRNDSVYTTRKHIAFCVSMIIIMTIVGACNATINVRFNLTRSLVHNVGFKATLLSAAVLVIFVLSTDILNRQKIWIILRECDDFDQQVRFECSAFHF